MAFLRYEGIEETSDALLKSKTIIQLKT